MVAVEGFEASILVHVPETVIDDPVLIGELSTGAAVQTAPTELMPEPVILIAGCAFTTVVQAPATVVLASSIPYMSERLPCKAEVGEVTVVAAILMEEGEPIADSGTYQS